MHNYIYDYAIMCISMLDMLLSPWQVSKQRLSWPGSRRKFECQLLQRALASHHVPRLGSSLWLLRAGFLLGPGYGLLYLILVSEAVWGLRDCPLVTKTRPESIVIKPPALGANNLAEGQDPESVASKGSHSNKERQPSRKGWNGFVGEGGRETAELYGGWEQDSLPRVWRDTECWNLRTRELEPGDKFKSM